MQDLCFLKGAGYYWLMDWQEAGVEGVRSVGTGLQWHRYGHCDSRGDGE